MARLTVLRDRDAFERRILVPLCIAGCIALPVLILCGVMR